MRFSQQVYWGGLPFPPPADHILSELSAMTCLGWPHTAWLIASSNYASSFTMTRQWSVSKKTPERPLDSKETKPFNLKVHSHWILVRRTDAETEISVFWSSDANNWLIGKVPDAGKDWGQKEKRVSLDEMAGWYHWCNEHEFGQTSGDVEGQGGRSAAVLGVTKNWT